MASQKKPSRAEFRRRAKIMADKTAMTHLRVKLQK